MTVLFGTTYGCLHAVRMSVPRQPGATSKQLQLRPNPTSWVAPATSRRGADTTDGDEAEADGEEGGAEQRASPSGTGPWIRPHNGALTAVDLQPDTQVSSQTWILHVRVDGRGWVICIACGGQQNAAKRAP